MSTRHHLIVMKPGTNGRKGIVLGELHVFGSSQQAAINEYRRETEAGADLIIMGHDDFLASQRQQEAAPVTAPVEG